jgi:hypothetical protein
MPETTTKTFTCAECAAEFKSKEELDGTIGPSTRKQKRRRRRSRPRSGLPEASGIEQGFVEHTTPCSSSACCNAQTEMSVFSQRVASGPMEVFCGQM